MNTSLPPSINTSANHNEEISTIFVVGFPEDMLEREFQNMFLFSPGFEAATLKIPNKDQEEDMLPNNNNNNNNNNNSNSGRKQIIGFAKFKTRMEAIEARDIINGRKVDNEKGSILKAEMAKKNLHTKRGLTLEQPFQTQMASPPTISNSYSSVLHTTSNRHPLSTSAYEAFHSVPSSSSSNNDLLFSPTTTTTTHHQNDYTYSDFFSPTLSTFNESTTSSTGTSLLFSPPLQPHPPLLSSLSTSTLTNNNNNNSNQQQQRKLSTATTSIDLRAASVGDIFNPNNNRINHFHRLSSKHIFEMDLHYPLNTFDNNNNNNINHNKNGHSINTSSSTSTSSIHSIPALSSSTHNNNTINNNNNNNNQHNNINNNSNSTITNNNHNHNTLLTSVKEENENENTSHQLNGLAINTSLTSSSSFNAFNGLTSPIVSSSISSTILTTPLNQNNNNNNNNNNSKLHNNINNNNTIISSTNPADQNAPCNTLYVGNLPPNTNEDELRVLFSKCLGYKRLAFRQKQNGPMCFVEFNDIPCAMQALKELNGTPLSNSMKGGIRLSFSKNPLGVRQQQQQPQSLDSISMLATSPPSVNLNNMMNSLSIRRDSNLLFDPQLS
ncbi:hypothetical protein BJ944DRAFT_235274 [Cunninghamella echinulata]|nr:hypothetical protein BJ944DRAFT_235274 [Cunninghamella echinulata]